MIFLTNLAIIFITLMSKEETAINVTEEDSEGQPMNDSVDEAAAQEEITPADSQESTSDEEVAVKSSEAPIVNTAEPVHTPEIAPLGIGGSQHLLELPASTAKPGIPKLAFLILGLIIIAVIIVSVSSGWHHKSNKAAALVTSNKWTTYSSSGGNFTALFPTGPTVSQQNVTLNGVSYNETTVQSSKNDAVYQVVYTTPEQEADTDATLDKLVHDTVSNIQSGQLLYSSYLYVNGHRTETFQITGVRNGNNVFMKGEFVVAGNIQYALLASQYDAFAPDSAYFLSHFSVN